MILIGIFYYFYLIFFVFAVLSENKSNTLKDNDTVLHAYGADYTSPLPALNINNCTKFGNYKSHNLKTFCRAQNTSKFESTKDSLMTEDDSSLWGLHSGNGSTHGNNDTGLLKRYKIYSYEEIKNHSKNNHKSNSKSFGKLNSAKTLDSSKDLFDNYDPDDNLNKILNVPHIQRMFLPLLNNIVTKLLNASSQDKHLKNQEAKKKKYNGTLKTINDIITDDKDDYLKRLDQYLDDLEYRFQIVHPTNLKTTEKPLIEDQFNLLYLAKALVDNVLLSYNNHHTEYNASDQDNSAINKSTRCRKFYNEKADDRYLNEINYKCNETLDDVLKEIILKTINRNPEESNNQILRNLKKLISLNPGIELEDCLKLHNLSIFKPELLYSDKMKETSGLDEDGDKYYSHNVVQMSKGRQDREYPLELIQQYSNSNV